MRRRGEGVRRSEKRCRVCGVRGGGEGVEGEGGRRSEKRGRGWRVGSEKVGRGREEE